MKEAFLLDRVKAMTVDTIIIILIMYLSSFIFESIGTVSAKVRMWLFLSLFVFYEPVFITLCGATVGNFVLKIRVRKFSNNQKNINILQSFLRYFFKILFGWFSFITFFTSKHRRAVHDYFGGSVMIKLE